MTIVPNDAIPPGTPAALDAPVVGAVAAAIEYPKWWDLATAAAFVLPDPVEGERGAWTVDGSGRLSRTGPGPVLVATSLDGAALDTSYAATFG